MVIFGPETPDVEIALAVAASVAIPLVFQPVEITWRHNGSAKTALFADGGLVSNLPVWAFEEEKQEFERITPLAPRVPVLAFSLVDSPVKQVAKPDAGGVAAADGAVPLKDGLELPQYVGMVARAAVYGSQSRIQRYMEDLYVIVLESSLSVLKFDLGINDARAAYQDGYRSGAERLRRTMRIQPGKVRAELVRFHDGVLDALNLHRSTRTLPPITRLRVAMIQRFGDRSMRVTHSINMDQDSEDRLKLDLRGVGAPEAYRTREPAFLLLPKSRAAGALPFFTKYELALVPSHVVSLIAIPVFEDYGAWSIAAPALRPQPLGVLCIDSEEDLVLAFADGHFLQALATASAACAPLFGKS
jgi:NTE family protein